MNTYIWCEDSSSGFEFWSEVFKVLDNKITVESKKNNSGLRKAVNNLNDNKNQYYILVDSAVDNPDVLREVKRIKTDISGKNNVKMISIHSFEFSLLSFQYLENWVFAEKDQLKTDREKQLNARKLFIDLVTNMNDPEKLNQFKMFYGYSENKNSEQISAKLLFEITRNTGFETDKSKIGECFVKSCCEYSSRNDDICGLDNCRLSSEEKIKQIIDNSVIKNALSEVGLYDYDL